MAAHDLLPGRSATIRTVADAMVHRPKVAPVTSTVADLLRLFVDPHVHAALIAVDDVLITVVDRDDVHSALLANTPATSLGTLLGRTVEPTASLETARQQLMSTGRRRLAVIDAQQRLLGLLCLKRTRDGFCSEQDLQSRQAETRRSATGESSGSPVQSYASDLAWTAPLDGGRQAS
jgi:CBS-domain-containing membrane protein